MREVIEVSDITDERLAMYASLTDAQLRHMKDLEGGVFVAESPKVIKVALECGLKPLSLLCERRHLCGDAREVLEMCPPGMDVFSGEREMLECLTGYRLTRGVLCAMERPMVRQLEDVVKGARRVCVLDGIVDSTNVGSIFRSAAALGMDAVVLSRQCCDPFNRRVVRVSMGSVFLVPWCYADDPVGELKALGFVVAALALRQDNVRLGEGGLEESERLAVVFGTEGDGLSEEVIARCDKVVKIPMSHNVDSLNVGAAAAVVFWELRPRV